MAEIPHARLIRSAHRRGLSASRNLLLQEAGADYVHFHDADGLFLPSWVQTVRDVLVTDNPDLALHEVNESQNGRMQASPIIQYDALARRGDLLAFAMWPGLKTAGMVILRELVRRAGGYRETLRRCEDFDFNVRLAASGPSYALIPEPLTVLRARTGSWSRDQRGVAIDFALACRFLGSDVPASHRQLLSELAARAGFQLYQLGEPERAEESLRVSRELGQPGFTLVGRRYQPLIRVLGPRQAARVGSAYRSVVPVSVRARLRR
jgi:hypothetical protein